MHRRLDRLVRRSNHVEDYRRLSLEEILHLPDEQLTRIIAYGTGQTFAEVDEHFKSLTNEQLEQIICQGEAKLLAANASLVTRQNSRTALAGRPSGHSRAKSPLAGRRAFRR
jgi:hypothetical protein